MESQHSMRRPYLLLTALLVLLVTAAIGQTPSRTFVDIITPQNASSQALITYKAQVEGYLNDDLAAINQLQGSTANLPQDEASIANLQARVAKLEAAATPPAPKTPISIAADKCTSGNCPGVATGDNLAVDGNKVLVVTGQTLDYAITIPAAGNYVLSVRLCNSTNSTGVTTVHFESPAGTPVGGGSVTLPVGVQWTTLSAPNPVAFAAGTINLRLVVEVSAQGFGGGLVDAITGTPQ